MLVFIKACERREPETLTLVATSSSLRLLFASLAGYNARLHQAFERLASGLRAACERLASEASQQHLLVATSSLAGCFASLAGSHARLHQGWLRSLTYASLKIEQRHVIIRVNRN